MTNSKVAILYDALFLEHDTGPRHPERAERLQSIVSQLRERGLDRELRWPAVKPADEQSIRACHKTEYIKTVRDAVADGHKNDPIGRLRCTETGYASVTRKLVSIADTHAGGRIVFILEGGYNTNALANSVSAVIEALHTRPLPGQAAGIVEGKNK